MLEIGSLVGREEHKRSWGWGRVKEGKAKGRPIDRMASVKISLLTSRSRGR